MTPNELVRRLERGEKYKLADEEIARPTAELAKCRTRQVSEALSRARNTAMNKVLDAPIPECGIFGEIAQDLDFVCAELGIDVARAPQDHKP